MTITQPTGITRPTGLTILQGVTALPELVPNSLAHYDNSTIIGSNPVTEWQNKGAGLSDFDLDVVVGTDANLITLETGVALHTGVSGDYFSTPDSATASITGSITLIAHVALPDWTPGTSATVIGKWTSSGSNKSYIFQIVSTGTLRLFTSVDGAAEVNSVSTTGTGFSAGTGHWIRVTWDDSADTANYYTSDEVSTTALSDITWTQLGTADVAHVSAGIADKTGVVEIGSVDVGTSNVLVAKVCSAHIISGTDPTTAAVVEFIPTLATVNTATFTSATGEVWTANGDAFVNATGFTGIYSRGSVGLETTAGQLITGKVTVVAVFKPTLAAPAAATSIYDARSDGDAQMKLGTNNASDDKYKFVQGGATVTITEAYDSDLRVLTMQFNGDATSKLTVSDVGSVTGDGGPDSWDFGSLFMTFGAGETVQGLFLEFVVYDRALNASEILQNQTFLEAKYS